MRMRFGITVFLGLVPSLAWAEPVLVPDFTPGTTSEFAIAYMLQSTVTAELSARGHFVVTQAGAQSVLGEGALASCADDPACPLAALPSLPARLAVVVRVRRLGSDVLGEVRVYQTAFPDPVEVWDLVVQSGQEQTFAQGVAEFVDGRSELLGPVDPAIEARARALMAGVGAEGPPDGPPPVEQPTPTTAEDRSPFSVGSRGAAAASGLSIDAWVEEARPHAGRLLVEVRGGLRIGDVVRSADVQVAATEGLDIASEWFQEGPSSGVAPVVGLGFGVAPVTWLDLAVCGDLVFGRRTVRTAWTLDGVAQEAGKANGASVMLAVQPVARVYAPPVGAGKAMFRVGADILMFDRYHVDVAGLDYPEPPGGVVAGPSVGVGAALDPTAGVGTLIEVVGTRHLGLRSGAAEDGVLVGPRPAPPEAAGWSVIVAATLQLRPPF
jgi:hypothetical protein